MNKQELIDKLASLVGSIEDFKGISTFHDGKYAGLEHALELIQQLDEPEFNDYLCDIKSQIEYLRIHGPGKIKSLRMLQNMVDNMITGCWSSTSIRTQKVKARLAKHWDEDLGDCLWWDFPVEEPPYCGTPLDDDFPKYKTHFTELHIPDEVEKEPLYRVKLGEGYFVEYQGRGALIIPDGNKEIKIFDSKSDAERTAQTIGGTVEEVVEG
ncbi:TPA: hypothetical protein ACF3DH_000026 [Enterococcus faecium]|uniref:hypothetical protein n=1 Tax=Enterococcus faecium TaxID=1352 RepID=UPI001F50DBC1|nr:hypothetical protein [Enterococcus faecium]